MPTGISCKFRVGGMGRQPGKLGNAHRTRCAYDCFSRMWVRVSYHRQNICQSVFKTNVMGRGGTRQRLKNKGYGKSAFRLTRGTGLTMSWEARPLHQCMKTFGSQTNSLTPFANMFRGTASPPKYQTLRLEGQQSRTHLLAPSTKHQKKEPINMFNSV